MDYRDEAAAELAKARDVNDRIAARAEAERQAGHLDLAAGIDREVAAASIRIAEGFIALAAARPGQETTQ